MTNKSYSQSPGPERELLRLLEHAVPEVRGLSALLVGKLAAAVPIEPAVGVLVRKLAGNDPDERVRGAAKQGRAGIERGRPKVNASAATRGAIIPPHGGYADLESYKMAEIAFDGTVSFCNRFINIRSRTHDQMVQAARSGKQNIVEGSVASGTSRKMEIKLVGVARASLEELLKDLHDFLRNRNLPTWDKNDPKAKEIRRIAYDKNKSYESYKSYIEHDSPEVAANALLCVIHQANYLLDKQLEALEAAFLEEGGFTERLYRVRSERKKKQKGA